MLNVQEDSASTNADIVDIVVDVLKSSKAIKRESVLVNGMPPWVNVFLI